MKLFPYPKEQLGLIKQVLGWVVDSSEGEMICSQRYNHDWIEFDDVSRSMLEDVCKNVNPILKRLGIKMKVKVCCCDDRITKV